MLIHGQIDILSNICLYHSYPQSGCLPPEAISNKECLCKCIQKVLCRYIYSCENTARGSFSWELPGRLEATPSCGLLNLEVEVINSLNTSISLKVEFSIIIKS